MSPDIITTIGLASAGITVASAGAALLVIRLATCRALSREVEDDMRDCNH